MKNALAKTLEILSLLSKELRREPIRRLRCENLINRANLILRKEMKKSPTEPRQTEGD